MLIQWEGGDSPARPFTEYCESSTRFPLGGGDIFSLGIELWEGNREC